MMGIPESQLKIGLEYFIPKIETKLNFNSLYTGKLYAEDYLTRNIEIVKSYWVHDARISKNINKNLNVYLSANNLLDENYEEEYGFPSRGRSLFFGLSYETFE